jgi:O-antigen/teichoic acid export membrane protein
VAIFSGENDRGRIKGTILFCLKVAAAISAIAAAVLFLSSNVVAVRLFDKYELSTVLKIFSIAIPFTAVTSILLFASQGFKVMAYRVAVRDIFEPVSRILIVIVLFAVGLRMEGAIIAFILSIILASFLAAWFLRRLFPQIRDKRVKPVVESKRILSFSWPLFLMSLSHLMFLWTGALLLGYFSDPQEVGIFVAAQRTAFLITMILAAFNAIFSPMISDLYNRKQFHSLEKLFKVETKWIFSISLPLVILIILFAEDILSLFGEEFILGTSCLILVSLGQLINTSVGSSEIMIMMSGKSKINLINLISILSFDIILSVILIPRHGILGAAVALALSIALLNVVHLIEVYVIFKIHPYTRGFYKPILSGLIAFLILRLTFDRFLHLQDSLLMVMIGSLIFMSVYVLSLTILGIEEEEKVIFMNILSKIKNKEELDNANV